MCEVGFCLLNCHHYSANIVGLHSSGEICYRAPTNISKSALGGGPDDCEESAFWVTCCLPYFWSIFPTTVLQLCALCLPRKLSNYFKPYKSSFFISLEHCIELLVLQKTLNLRAKEDSFFDFGFTDWLIDWYFYWRYWKPFPSWTIVWQDFSSYQAWNVTEVKIFSLDLLVVRFRPSFVHVEAAHVWAILLQNSDDLLLDCPINIQSNET